MNLAWDYLIQMHSESSFHFHFLPLTTSANFLGTKHPRMQPIHISCKDNFGCMGFFGYTKKALMQNQTAQAKPA